MRTYFKLQFKMLNRHFNDFGLPPFVAYILLLIIFTGLSIYLFNKTAYAPWIYLTVALSLTFKLSEQSRNDFLKLIFSKPEYQLIRIIENVICVFPFTLWLIYRQFYLHAILLLFISPLFSLIQFSPENNTVLPTPFAKRPFEFITGFRKSFYLFVALFILCAISIFTGNFNLGIVALVISFLIILSFYSEPETDYDVWIYAFKPFGFLAYKIKTAILFSSLLTLPITLSLAIFFSDKIYILLIVQILGFIYVMSMILAKYAAFPLAINIPQGILLAVGLVFPPLLLVIIPYFYMKSIQQLSVYLA